MRIEVVVADITTLAVDAIVNAANERLLGGGGVDGAIHRAAGERLAEACKAIALVAPYTRCPTGQARITPGFALPARLVIHTVGPVWQGGGAGEAALLRDCYRNSLRIAEEHAVDSIALPAISCGVFRYPPDEAARIAVDAVRAWSRHHAAPSRFAFCCFDQAMAQRYGAALDTG